MHSLCAGNVCAGSCVSIVVVYLRNQSRDIGVISSPQNSHQESGGNLVENGHNLLLLLISLNHRVSEPETYRGVLLKDLHLQLKPICLISRVRL